MKIREGDKLPDAKVFILEKDPKEISIKQVVGNKRVILFGLPGAFTATCSAKHLPGFINNFHKFTSKGIEISDLDARKHVYGMPYSEWKEKYQK